MSADVPSRTCAKGVANVGPLGAHSICLALKFAREHPYRSLQRYDDSVEAYLRWVKINPRSLIPSIGLVLTYQAAGRKEEARAAAAEVRKRNPKFSAKRFVKGQPYRDPTIANRLFEYLRKAGLPE